MYLPYYMYTCKCIYHYLLVLNTLSAIAVDKSFHTTVFHDFPCRLLFQARDHTQREL